MNVKEVGCEGVKWMKVARHIVHLLAVVSIVVKAGRFLTNIRRPGMKMKLFVSVMTLQWKRPQQ
jgi:hypothetical protein